MKSVKLKERYWGRKDTDIIWWLSSESVSSNSDIHEEGDENHSYAGSNQYSNRIQ